MKFFHLLSSLTFFLCSNAVAETIAFDDIAIPDWFFKPHLPMPDGYASFDWNNFGVTIGSDRGFLDGYKVGTVSPKNIAVGGSGLSTIASPTPFAFESGWFTGAWRDGLSITATGYNGATLAHQKTFVVNSTAATQELFYWTGLTRLTFDSFGGQKNPALFSDGTQFALDDLVLLTFKDVIQNVVAKPDGHGITATFSTKPGYTLEQAAQLGEFDHFNWLNFVTDDTHLDKCVAAGRPENCRSLKDKDDNLPIKDPSEGYFDAVEGGYQYQVDERNKNFPLFFLGFPVRDDLLYYLDYEFTLDGLPTGNPDSTIRGKFTDTFTLRFNDNPCTPFGEHINYLTTLKGVKRGGVAVDLATLGVTTEYMFRWRYDNMSFDPKGCSGHVSLLDNLDPTLVSTGVSTFLGFVGPDDLTPGERLALQKAGMEFPMVSEPSSLLMLSTFVAMLLVMESRLRRRRLVNR